MKQYLELMRHTLDCGHRKNDRTGTGTLSVFGYQMRFDLSEGFPLVTTKKVHLKSVIHELLWFLKGDTNIKYLNDNGVHIWDEWANDEGDLGPVYGAQWRAWAMDGRRWQTIDQISLLIQQIKKNPDSRRLIVSAWNVADVGLMALPPCHLLFQFYVRGMTLSERLHYEDKVIRRGVWTVAAYEKRGWYDSSRNHEFSYHEYLDSLGVPRKNLSCQLYQRSGDIFLGVPFNIASYALLTMMVAQVCGLAPGEFIHTIGDAHLYLNHRTQTIEQLSRQPKKLPMMKLNPSANNIFDFKYEDFTLKGYNPHPAIKAPVAV